MDRNSRLEKSHYEGQGGVIRDIYHIVLYLTNQGWKLRGNNQNAWNDKIRIKHFIGKR
jgi:hypothetical protein